MNNVGMIAFLQKRYEEARETIGAPRAPSLEEEIREQMAPAVAALSVHDRLTCRERGRTLDLAAAVDLALTLCDGVRSLRDRI